MKFENRTSNFWAWGLVSAEGTFRIVAQDAGIGQLGMVALWNTRREACKMRIPGETPVKVNVVIVAYLGTARPRIHALAEARKGGE